MFFNELEENKNETVSEIWKTREEIFSYFRENPTGMDIAWTINVIEHRSLTIEYSTF